MDFIAEILSIFIKPLYSLVNNYGLTIIIFTVILKLATLPFTIKSQKSMARMQQVQPIISEIQRKYANNREKMQEELMKVYDKYEVSPTGGCMPMILQLVILMGFIQVVYKPYTFILGISKTAINGAVDFLQNAENGLVEVFTQQVTDAGVNIGRIAEQQLEISKIPLLMDKLNLTPESLNLDFFGIDLTKVLQQNMTDVACWILPLIALGLTILSTVISQRSANKKQNENAKKDAQAQQAQAMTKSMFIMMPLMTAWITFTMPLGCALYWGISTLTQIIQQALVDQFVVKKMKPIELKKKKKTVPKVKPQVEEVIDVEENTED